jgi:hypothetical protein
VELRAMRHPPLEDQPVRLAQTVQDWFVALDAALPDEPAPAG